MVFFPSVFSLFFFKFRKWLSHGPLLWQPSTLPVKQSPPSFRSPPRSAAVSVWLMWLRCDELFPFVWIKPFIRQAKEGFFGRLLNVISQLVTYCLYWTYHGIFLMNPKSYNKTEIHENKLTPPFKFFFFFFLIPGYSPFSKWAQWVSHTHKIVK